MLDRATGLAVVERRRHSHAIAGGLTRRVARVLLHRLCAVIGRVAQAKTRGVTHVVVVAKSCLFSQVGSLK